MIKYKIETGDKIANNKARGDRDLVYKPALRGLHCGKCKADTLIEFVSKDIPVSETYTMRGVIVPVYHACCSEFEERLKAKVESYGKNLLR